jgi:hypothetical protein
LLTFIHKDTVQFYEYLCFETKSGFKLEASGEHLIYCLSNKNQGVPKFMLARSVIAGDFLVKYDGSLQEIATVYKIFYKGCYAPLSQSGTLIINDFVVSCYAECDHNDCHLFMKPLIMYKNSTFKEGNKILDTQIQPYAKTLQKYLPN